MDEPRAETVRFYGQPSELDRLPWAWVDDQLGRAGLYWVIGRAPSGPPHPRPVWGVWSGGQVHLSLGSPVLRGQLAADPTVTVHLESGTDVVVVEGVVSGSTAATDLLAAYDAKYDWSYEADRYGPFTSVRPTAVLAWRTAGPAGRDSFQQAGRWTFD